MDNNFPMNPLSRDWDKGWSQNHSQKSSKWTNKMEQKNPRGKCPPSGKKGNHLNYVWDKLHLPEKDLFKHRPDRDMIEKEEHNLFTQMHHGFFWYPLILKSS